MQQASCPAEGELQAESPDLVTEFLDSHPDWTSNEFEATARKYAARAELEHPINRAPTTIAAAAIYTAGLLVNEKLTQAEVAAASGVSVNAIRETYTEILDCEGIATAARHGETTPSDEQATGRIGRLVNRVMRRE